MVKTYLVTLVTRYEADGGDEVDFKPLCVIGSTTTSVSSPDQEKKQQAIKYAFNYIENNRVEYNTELQTMLSEVEADLQTDKEMSDDYKVCGVSAKELRTSGCRNEIYWLQAELNNFTEAISLDLVPNSCRNMCRDSCYIATINFDGLLYHTFTENVRVDRNHTFYYCCVFEVDVI